MAGTGFPEFDRELSRINEQLQLMKDIPEKLAEVNGVAEAADGFIKVTVDSTGKMQSIEINPRAMRMDSQTLSEELLNAARAAYEDMQRNVQEVVAPESLGIDGLEKLAERRTSETGLSENAMDIAGSIMNSPDPIREMMKTLQRLQGKL